MADFTFNVAKGRVNELVRRVVQNDPANSAIVAIGINAGGVTDATLIDLDDVAAILGTAADEVGTRKVLTDADLSLPAVVDGSDWQSADLPDFTLGVIAAGAADLTDVLFAYDPDTTGGTDANLVPLTFHDFPVVTDGTEIIVQVPELFRAQ